MHRCISSVAYGKLAYLAYITVSRAKALRDCSRNQHNNNLYSTFNETQGHLTQVLGVQGKKIVGQNKHGLKGIKRPR